ncbi:MAG: transposase [Chitinophagaceae bacterium]|jgi:transposase-like protein|nr:transposase [Chitinophagaceae bacterium]
MATIEQLKTNRKVLRPYRYFSEDFKKKKVAELDKKQITVTEICKEYEVSYTAVYKWIYKYSVMRKKGIKMVVEAESDTAKIKSLKDHITRLEQLLGQKQFQIDFLEKQMEIASDQYGIELKKKLSGKPSAGSGNTDKNTPTS